MAGKRDSFLPCILLQRRRNRRILPVSEISGKRTIEFECEREKERERIAKFVHHPNEEVPKEGRILGWKPRRDGGTHVAIVRRVRRVVFREWRGALSNFFRSAQGVSILLVLLIPMYFLITFFVLVSFMILWERYGCGVRTNWLKC